MKNMRNTLASLALGGAVALMPAMAHAWWNKDWTTRAKVTLNTSATGVETKEAVSGLVVPLRLHSGNFDFTMANEDGSDLRVVAADDKTPVPFAVERFDGVNELAVLWVPVQSLLPGSDKNVLHVYAGNAKATSEAAVNVFANGPLMVVHFAEPDGPARDTVAGATTGPDNVPAREANGLLGGSAKFTGTALSWPANDKLKLAASSAVTASMWIKPETVASGTLLQWGGLKLALQNGQLAAEVGDTRLAGGTLPAATWAHVALSVGAGKALLYINGAKAAEADAVLPAVEGALAVGGGYTGLLDELQISPDQRSAEWLLLSAASQGAAGKLVASVKESAEEAESASGEVGHMNILIKNLTTDAWVVIIILALMFVLACWVMVNKFLFVGRTDRDNRSFLRRFRAASLDLLHLEDASTHPRSSLHRLYLAGVRELNKRDVGTSDVKLSGASLDAVKASVDADLVRESHHLNSHMVLLTIAISGGPFLGLLGTVAGVMITFAAIAAVGEVNVNAIAPGIASALLATVAGLVVAIPALFGYNYLASRIKNTSSDMQIFVDEFVTRVAETYGQR
ncbi:MAG: hypothetical protein RLZZ618_3103 [Pseudomonadota bacterium]|jgi:biopolymer transport protein ExbB